MSEYDERRDYQPADLPPLQNAPARRKHANNPVAAAGGYKSIPEMRERAFELLGFGENEYAEMLGRMISALNEGLAATKVDRQYYHGELVSEEVVPDIMARLKSVREAADLLGLGVSKAVLGQQGNGPAQVSISLNVPFLEQLRAEKDVTPLQEPQP